MNKGVKNIGISGIIGVGKSTLTQKIADKLGFKAFMEPVDTNEYLDLFYTDMKKYGFPMQIYLLNKRFRLHQQSVWGDKGTVQDRTIYEDTIFAKMLHESKDISDIDYNTYSELFDNMSYFLHRPDVIVYLDTSPETALERIKNRNRECETDMSLEYLTALRDGYEQWLVSIRNIIPVVRIDWNTFGSVDDVIEKIDGLFM